MTTSQGSPLPYVDISTIHRFRASIENVRTNDDVYISFHLSLSLIHTEESHPSKPDGKKGLSACNSFQMHGCDSISGTLGFSLASFRPPRLPIEHTLIENRTRNNKEQESLSTVHVCFLFVFKLHFFVSHGTQDQVIPIDWARKTPNLLNDLKIKNVFKEYHNGHGINLPNFNDLMSWLK